MTRFTGPPGRDQPNPDDPEAGLVLVWMAMLLVTLLGIAALVIDVGYWYMVGNREQNAADAAALAAAVYWPAAQTQASTEAQDAATSNGFTNNTANTRVTVAQGTRPTYVTVTVSRDVTTYFARALGLNQKTLTRSATAEYQGPVPMGSPANSFGDEPVQTSPAEIRWSSLYGPSLPEGTKPQFWANVSGPREEKSNGDAHQAKSCTATNAQYCPQSGVAPPANMQTSNTDYRAEGYLYNVTVSPPPANAAKLAIEIFDPAQVNVGIDCTDNLSGASAYDTGTPNRYASGDTSPFCSGDRLFNTGDTPMTTTFTVREPDDTPWDNLDNDPIATTACDSGYKQFKGYTSSVASLLSTNAAEPNVKLASGAAARFRDIFRKWFRVCELNVSQVPSTGGNYILQVRTNAALGAPYGTTLNVGEGGNRFSLRAGWLTSTGTPIGTGVSIAASDAMSLTANSTGADTRFFLARVYPGADGRILRLRFFDTGDASQSGDLSVLPPTDAKSNGTTVTSFTGCTVTRPGTGQVDAPAASGCKVTNLINTTDDADWIQVDVPIPAGYTCDQTSSTGCWVRARFQYGLTVDVHDTTTWSAQIVGDPVRLVR
jgi:hypothetical protein